MEHRVFLAIGNNRVEEDISGYKDVVIVDHESNLELLKELMQHLDMEFLILNSLLDESGELLIEIAKEAKKKDIKVILLLPSIDNNKKLIGALVSQNVNSFIEISSLNEEVLLKSLEKYPLDFNFNILSGEQKVKVIEKEKIKIEEKEIFRDIEVVGDAVITFISAAPSGKSYLSWNAAHAFSNRDYKVALINFDRCNSANSLFGIEPSRDSPFDCIEDKTLEEVIEGGVKVNKNLTIYTGKFGSKTYLKEDQFIKILNMLRAQNNIVIIDSPSDFEENLLLALNYSNTVVFVFDLDNSHFKLNLLLLDKVAPVISKNKTIAVINNVPEGSGELNKIKQKINNLEKFKEILVIRNAGKTAYDFYYSNTCNYLGDKGVFTQDFESLLSTLRLRNYGKRKKVSLFNFICRR